NGFDLIPINIALGKSRQLVRCYKGRNTHCASTREILIVRSSTSSQPTEPRLQMAHCCSTEFHSGQDERIPYITRNHVSPRYCLALSEIRYYRCFMSPLVVADCADTSEEPFHLLFSTHRDVILYASLHSLAMLGERCVDVEPQQERLHMTR